MEIIIDSLQELPRAAGQFVAALEERGRRVVAFRGEMGAGKTTLIAEICRRLGVDDTAASPSFAIINEYRAPASGEVIYHFDFYRLDSPEEAMEIGAEDYFYSGRLCLIEWPERVESLLPPDTLFVDVEADPLTGRRTITFSEP